ncbi:MAG: class B sortase [Emergencia sp.]
MTKEKKKRGDILYRIIIVCLIAIILFSMYKIGSILLEYYQGTKAYETVQELAGASSLAQAETPDLMQINFDALQKEYPDVKAWIYSEDTVINYPVVQGDDNQYYLYRMVNGEWNGKGTLFIDYRCEKPFEDFNTIIYGHRMKDGSMFRSLVEYRDAEYYEKHKEMLLLTPEKRWRLVIFGVVTIPADSDMYRFDFAGKAEKQAYLDWIEEHSETDTGVKVTAADRIVMMSTCTYEFDDARLIVYGKLEEIEEDEK